MSRRRAVDRRTARWIAALVGVLALVGIALAVRTLRPDVWVGIIQPIEQIFHPPTRIPRSFSRIKPQLDVAWSADAIDGVVQRAVAAHVPLRPLYQPDLHALDVPSKLDLRPTDIIADIGSGTGALEIDLLERGASFAKIYAIDIDPVSIDVLTRILPMGPWGHPERVIPLLVEPGSFGLPPEAVDVIVVDTVQLHQPMDESDAWKMHPGGTPPEVLDMLRKLLVVLKPGGRLHVIENLPNHHHTADAVRIPYVEAGFAFQRSALLTDPSTMTGAWHLVFVRPEARAPAGTETSG
jgi:SAM-dependent methyltransferase